MANQAYLRQARSRVRWGGVNLSSYSGEGIPENTPIVYNIQVDLVSENEGPTATMKWDPTGPGMAVYEKFVSEKIKEPIIIEFFYADGKIVPFVFFWSGQSVNYGNEMSITVNMQSQLSGLINANIRNTAQVYDEKKGATPTSFVERTKKQFGLESYPDLVQYNAFTEKYWNKVKLLNQYGNDWTFGNAIGSIAKQTGDQVYPNNIRQTSVVVMPPFSYGGDGWEEVVEATSKTPSTPDPKVRYGYFIGPSIINSVTRKANWKPPQQSNENTPGSQQYARDPKTGKFISKSSQLASETAKRTSAPLGTANARANPTVENKDNPKGPDRQNAINDEKSSELTFDTFLCPVLVGLKPHDILYIPALDGKYIEDWIVQSVGYSQEDGKIVINVRATRVFGVGSPMNPKSGEKFLALAKSLKLVGPNSNLSAWDEYAWGIAP
jgi:hypothetical protein